MKKIAFIIVWVIASNNLSAQTYKGDSLLNVIIASKVDSVKIQTTKDLFFNYIEYFADTILYYSRKVLQIAEQQKNKNLEALCYAEIGFAFTKIGDRTKGLELTLKGLQIAELMNNEWVLSRVYDVSSIFYGFSDRKGLDLAFKALGLARAVGDYKQAYHVLNTLSFKYRGRGQNDSALIYVLQAYELMTRFHFTELSVFTLSNLSAVHLALGNHVLALAFARMAMPISPITLFSDQKQLNSYGAIANYYQETGNLDSNFYYIKKMFGIWEKRKIGLAISAQRLYEIYKARGNNDSALKYLEIVKVANDKVNDVKNIQKLQGLRFQEELRQKELEAEKEQAKKALTHNIQYAAIAIGLIFFIILFLLFSHSIIVNAKLIEFFGVIGLLVVFEFINLILHPFLVHATGDSPLLMLIALVCIAALLVPAHHYLQKWITNRLVDKNNKIRLTAAKKTIAKLEGEQPK